LVTLHVQFNTGHAITATARNRAHLTRIDFRLQAQET
jgi:hypothetical protein